MKARLLLITMLIFIPIAASADFKSIDIELDYNSYPKISSDDIISFTVLGTAFSWPVNPDNLCTLWTVEPGYASSVQQQCFGSKNCCSINDLGSSSEYWDDDFNLISGALGSADDYTISGGTITFATAPRENHIIQVNYRKA